MPDTHSSTPSLITSTIDFDSPGFHAGHLRLPYSHDRSGYGFIPVPVFMVHAGPGPTVLLTGGNHGDEYEGPIALMKLARRLPWLSVRGRLIVIPALNYPAVMNATRTSPIDGGNLNRSFPGQRNGTLTEMIAHHLETVLFPITDVAFDLHAGGASTNYLPTLLAAWPDDERKHADYTRLVDTIGAPRTLIMDLLGENRTFAAAAQRHGVMFFCGEFGGHAVCNLDGLEVAERSIERLLTGLDLIDGPAPRAGTVTYAVEGHRHYVFAPEAGIFEPAFRLGDQVKAGQPAGWIHHPSHPQRPATPVHFEGDGMAICIRALAHCEAGDCLGHLASVVSH
ncbi:succinylglutamate desuccinylase/aspartoacylase family protein [Xylophilus sp.]|uniref:succinylglutamate desuccinylase/aspartoacylase family protein n=1 Tax=Xylophilus sp. TaxID=2653893 RepID=UPI0013BC44D5|nr:succinylglutamate desuccinylase/aspartoacylase family protein [Xylophilus sp.]KAF1044639.1 MAG: N-alpha-acetyl-L-2,4-diaminobutyric acid deacetylase [Xylophilus sp.]